MLSSNLGFLKAEATALLGKSGQYHSNDFIAIIVQAPRMNTVQLAMTQLGIIYTQSMLAQLKNFRSVKHISLIMT